MRSSSRLAPRPPLITLTATLLALAMLLVVPGLAPRASAAGERVDVWLTTTSDSGGRQVTRGLEQQAPLAFGPAGGAADQTITVDESTTYQRFEGGGASITDTTAYLLRGGAVTPATRDAVMRSLFHPSDGIGLSFVRNPIGASDLSRPGHVSLDDTCCDLSDFGANGYDTDVRLLTVQAKQLNPALRVKGVPWSAPGWMKDNGRMDQMGWLRWEYYPMYAEYLVKYIQSYQAAGVPIDYISVQNEPNCCQADNPTAMDYPGMNWNPSGLVEFTKNHVYPAFRAAGIATAARGGRRSVTRRTAHPAVRGATCGAEAGACTGAREEPRTAPRAGARPGRRLARPGRQVARHDQPIRERRRRRRAPSPFHAPPPPAAPRFGERSPVCRTCPLRPQRRRVQSQASKSNPPSVVIP